MGDLLIMSAQETRGRLDCGLQGISEDVSDERFRGLRIFDISDLEAPVQVGAVQTCRGSHTHSVVSGPGDDGKIVVYNSVLLASESARRWEAASTPPGRSENCAFRIDVIEIPVDDPGSSRIVHSPTVFADEETGAMLAYGAVAITVMTHRKPVEPISVMTLPFSPRRTSRQEPAPVMAFCSISPIPEIQSESMS